MSEPFALYVHVPWCRHVCPYCDFNVWAAARIPEDDYIDTVIRELTAWTAAAPWTGRQVGSVYLGGGTPSLLSPSAVGRLLHGIDARCGIAADAEVTIEANPGTVTESSLAGYRAGGVNRLSLGTQSFQPALLRALGRDHAAGDTAGAVTAARAAGFANVSLDLIFAVPGETPADWEHDLRAAIALAPEHVSAYALTWEEGTPFHAWRARGRIRAVDDDAEATMAETAAALLPAAGYARYELSSWARPGFAARHNNRYWDGSDYLGLGPGAHSHAAIPFPGRRWANLRRPDEHRAAVLARGTAVDGEEHLTEAQARADFLMTGLRRTAGIAGASFRLRFGVELADAFPHVDGLVRDGLLERAGDQVRLSARGLRFADTVVATFV